MRDFAANQCVCTCVCVGKASWLKESGLCMLSGSRRWSESSASV